jgi:lysophospholipase L1-like esterase
MDEISLQLLFLPTWVETGNPILTLVAKRWMQALGAGLAIGVTTIGLTAGFGTPNSAAAATTPAPVAYYLDLGGSASVGFQPTAARPHGQPTDTGYANDLLAAERARWPSLQLVQFGCPGETTMSFLFGGDRCRPAGQTQLAEALAFLHTHPNTVLLTIDLGFNDIEHCLAFHAINPICLSDRLVLVRQQLPEILSALRAAGGPALRIVGVGHYDPFLGAYAHGEADQAFAEASEVAIDRLDATLHSVYDAAGIPMADVERAFAVDQTEMTDLTGFGDVPRNVARTCSLTWACTAAPGPGKQHPNNLGYQVIARAIAAVVPD